MSRSRHPRPPAQTGDDLSRVTQAAIALADDVTRMGRSQERLVRAVAAAEAAGYSQAALNVAVGLAARGREDRRRALEAVAGAPKQEAASRG